MDGSGDTINLLLVDDRLDKLVALEAILSDLGANLIKASSGRDALRLLLRHEVAAILLDVSMPDMDGFETASIIRQRANLEHTPIIFITSINTSDTHVTKGYSLGAVDYIFTPIVPEILRTKVSVFIDLHKKNQLIKQQSTWLYEEAERRAHELETRLRGLLNRLNVGVFRASTKNELLEANPALLRILGVNSLEEAQQTESMKLIMENTRRLPEDDTSASTADLQLAGPNNEEIWVRLSGLKSRDGDGQIYTKGIVENITQRKEAEEALSEMNLTLERRVQERTEALKLSQDRLFRAERLASLGTLATGIAHEINNPLNAILMTAEYALQSKKADYHQSMEIIANETRRCGKIIHGVLQFARNQKTVKAPYNLNTVVLHAVDLLRSYISASVTLNCEVSETPLPILMNTTEIEQVIINIVQNAAEAGIEGAHVSVRTMNANGFAILTIEDDGPGIPSDIVDKIFDPFFSTRVNKGGTGLGLSVTHGIITEHEGTIEVESNFGAGAKFTLKFPLNESENSVETDSQKQRSAHGASV